MNPPDIDAVFRNMTDALEIDIVKPVSLDKPVEALLDHFIELLAAAGSVDINDIKALQKTHSILTDRISRFFSHSEELTYDTEIIVNGNTVVLMLNENDADIEANFLDQNDRIHGKIRGLYVGEVPDESIFTHREDRTEISDEYDEVETIPFGLALVLDDALISDENGDTQSIPENITICVPLNYSSLRLTKI